MEKDDKNKDKTVVKDDETVTTTQEGTQGTSSQTGRPNIDVITARNEEEVRQDRRLSYKRVGIVMLLVVVIIIGIYFLS